MNYQAIKKIAPDLHRLLIAEINRQKNTINLIPSENIISNAVLQALATPFTNKYAEGQPKVRYYPGNEISDKVELEAQKLALKLFLRRLAKRQKWSVNVQPYSGSPANLAVYFGLLKPRDKILGLELSSGGHLSHGAKASISGQIFKTRFYKINPKTELIDYRELEKIAKKFKPKIIVSGISAYSRKVDFKKIGRIAEKVKAWHLADISHIAGLITAGLHQSPFPYADIVTTTIHKTLRGPRAALIFAKKELMPKINKAVFPGLQGGPHLNTIFAVAVSLKEALKPSFKNYQKQIIKNAKVLAGELKKYGFEILTGGSENHMLLINLKPLGLTGRQAQDTLEKVNILANRNTIYGDISAFSPSGLRLGTPAVTTRGFKERQIKKIAQFIWRLLIKKDNPLKIRKEVLALCRKFPLAY